MTPEEKTLAPIVGRRLKAVMGEYRLNTVGALAEVCEAQRGATSNWLNGYNLPPVWRIVPLCDKTELTMDWVYRGVGRGMPLELVERLDRRVKAIEREQTPATPAVVRRPKARASAHQKKARVPA